MDIAKELEQAQKKLQELVKKVQALEQEKQQVLQEALKLEGEIRLLVRLGQEKKDKNA